MPSSRQHRAPSSHRVLQRGRDSEAQDVYHSVLAEVMGVVTPRRRDEDEPSLEKLKQQLKDYGRWCMRYHDGAIQFARVFADARKCSKYLENGESAPHGLKSSYELVGKLISELEWLETDDLYIIGCNQRAESGLSCAADHIELRGVLPADKSSCGWNHGASGRALVPASDIGQYQENPAEYRSSVRAKLPGGVQLSAGDMPSFMYHLFGVPPTPEDEEALGIRGQLEGTLCRSAILVRVIRFVFRSPTAAHQAMSTDEPAAEMEEEKVKEVTVYMIAYAAMLIRHSLSSNTHFKNAADGISAREFYQEVVALFGDGGDPDADDDDHETEEMRKERHNRHKEWKNGLWVWLDEYALFLPSFTVLLIHDRRVFGRQPLQMPGPAKAKPLSTMQRLRQSYIEELRDAQGQGRSATEATIGTDETAGGQQLRDLVRRASIPAAEEQDPTPESSPAPRLKRRRPRTPSRILSLLDNVMRSPSRSPRAPLSRMTSQNRPNLSPRRTDTDDGFDAARSRLTPDLEESSSKRPKTRQTSAKRAAARGVHAKSTLSHRAAPTGVRSSTRLKRYDDWLIDCPTTMYHPDGFVNDLYCYHINTITIGIIEVERPQREYVPRKATEQMHVSGGLKNLPDF
ncbi:hypothetical protein BD626DRAFT_542665 [Schizophyllum amplum]|uniref:Uncharacterized protein n=1 Tax=Schizophyllum amplum TaxID=97359 RepID=A0A550BSC8_9AGAR|nr:hypothetical protein BD626DRAFT_542665 [Auriculariopsis ampla]